VAFARPRLREGTVINAIAASWGSPAEGGLRAAARLRCLIASLLLCVAAFVCIGAAGPAAASARVRQLDIPKPALGRGGSAGAYHWACPRGACLAIIVPAPKKVAGGYVLPGSSRILDGSGERNGLDPQDLQSAYDIPGTIESPQTIAVVDAFGYPDAESDLATYRERYGLPPCTSADGCFEKVNQKGVQGDYPREEEGWDVEAALDEDMASAACPQCHILLVEGNGEMPAELGAAVDTAARLGATEISNSYGYPEALTEICGRSECAQYEKDYEHPGVLITASSGDAGYADTYFELGLKTTNFPGSSPNVVAIGGTALFKERDAPRGWFEEVWNEPAISGGTGSGCTSKPKPKWQTDRGCSKRTDDDIAAVAAVVTPVSIRVDSAWTLVGGTSVASPLVAGIEAHASAYSRSLGASAFYEEPGSLNDVTEGFNWNADGEAGTSECAPEEYLCNAEVGYDGPTGMGTPHGVPALNGAPTVEKVTPRRGPLKGGTKVEILGSDLDGATEVDFGTKPATSFSVVSPTSISAVTPAGSKAGSVVVSVVTKGGKSSSSRGDRFSYAR